MNWQTLLIDKRVAAEPSSKMEIDELRSMAELNLSDANVPGLSSQGRYEFAYNAARLVATMLIRASGYRVIAKNGHHLFTFQALVACDAQFTAIAAYFDQARYRRNHFSYDTPASLSDTDANDLLEAVNRFLSDGDKWISRNYPLLQT